MPRTPTGKKLRHGLALGRAAADIASDWVAGRGVDVVRNVLAGVLRRRIHARAPPVPGLHGRVVAVVYIMCM
jgi:hypothetical protein